MQLECNKKSVVVIVLASTWVKHPMTLFLVKLFQRKDMTDASTV